MKSIEPLGRTLFGTTAWPMFGDASACLTWDGPGAPVYLRRLEHADRGAFTLGERLGEVAGPVLELAEVQAAVDRLHATRAERAARHERDRAKRAEREARAWLCGGCAEALRACSCGGQTCGGVQHAESSSHWCRDGGRGWRRRSQSRRSTGTK